MILYNSIRYDIIIIYNNVHGDLELKDAFRGFLFTEPYSPSSHVMKHFNKHYERIFNTLTLI